MKKHIAVILFVTLLVSFYACTHKPGVLPSVTSKDSVVNNNNNNSTPQDSTTSTVDTSVCFQRDVLPIFTGSCAISGCHDAASHQDGYTLTDYAHILLKGLKAGNSAGSKVYTECTKGKMPQYPTPKLDSAQLSYIRRWIDNGAHNDTNCAVICDTTKYTYTNAIVPILTSYCYSCHAAAPATASGGGIVLDNYNGVQVQAQNGKLLGDLSHTSGFNFMPLGGNKLSDCKIAQVRKWIEAGARNN